MVDYFTMDLHAKIPGYNVRLTRKGKSYIRVWKAGKKEEVAFVLRGDPSAFDAEEEAEAE